MIHDKILCNIIILCVYYIQSYHIKKFYNLLLYIIIIKYYNLFLSEYTVDLTSKDILKRFTLKNLFLY